MRGTIVIVLFMSMLSDVHGATSTARSRRQHQSDYLSLLQFASNIRLFKGTRAPRLHDTSMSERCMNALPTSLFQGSGTMKGPQKMTWMLSLASRIAGVPGDVVEAGVAEGGAALAVLFYLGCTGDLDGREVHLFDTWEGLPPATTSRDEGFHVGEYKKGMNSFYANVDRFKEAYAKLLQDNTGSKPPVNWDRAWSHVKIHKGLFNDTMPSALAQRPVALLMCDGDMYGSTIDCLDAAEPRLVKGGWHYNDDYYTFAGSYDAVQDYRKAHNIVAGQQESQIYVVTQTNLTDVPEQAIPDLPPSCKPPQSNSAAVTFVGEGTCGSKQAQAGIWQKLV